MVHASLFSGIGGPEVAAAMMGWRNAFHCEINPFGRAVLEYWFPDSVSYEDITKTDFSEWRGRIDVLTGGFPCQPFSYAGKRGGRDDDRYLWPEMLRVIGEVRPTWVVGENVAGITTMVEGGVCADLGGSPTLFGEGDDIHEYALRQSFTIERICRDLERVEYSVQPMLVPAAAVGAPHRRDRVFILANIADPDCGGGGEVHEHLQPELADWAIPFGDGRERDATDPERDGLEYGVHPGAEGGLFGTQGAGGEDRLPVKVQYAPADGRGRFATDTDGGGCPPQGSGEGVEGCRCHDALAGERGFTAQWTDGLPGLHRCHPSEKWREFPSVSPVHRGNDGIPIRLDNLSLPFAKWRNESLKAYGNAIVPQVMYRIFQAIEQVTH